MFPIARRALGAAALFLLSLPVEALAQARFEVLPLEGGFPIEAYYSLGVSADGRSVVGRNAFGQTSGAATAAVWREGEGLTDLGGFPPSSPGGFVVSYAYGISADGSTVAGQASGGTAIASSGEAVLFRSDGTIVPMAGDLVGDSYGFDVSADGSVAVGTHVGGFTTTSGFVYDDVNGRRMINDLILHTGASHAGAISDDGRAIAGWLAADTISNPEAYLYHETEGLRRLGFIPNGSYSRADAISADGSTVVGYATDDVGGFAMKWTEADGMVSLGSLLPGLPNRRLSQAYGVSGDGSVVVGESNGRAFVHSDAYGGMVAVQDLLIALGVVGLEDWILYEATGVSHDGKVITGWGFNESEGLYSAAWRAVIPEPSTALLVGLGLMAIASPSRRGREARSELR